MQPGNSLGPFASAVFGAAFLTWQLQITPSLWPAGPVLQVDVEYNNGSGWQAEGGVVYGGGGSPGTIPLSIIRREGAAAVDQVRFTFTPLQTCSATFALVGIPAAVGQAVKL